MNEIFYKKDKNGWTAYDKFGHSITAPTKDIARMRYFMHYVQPNQTSDLFMQQKEIKSESL